MPDMSQNNLSVNPEMMALQKDLAYLRKDMENVMSMLNNINEKIEKKFAELDNKYVTKTEFDPIKKIVYGLVALMLSSFITALLALIIKQ